MLGRSPRSVTHRGRELWTLAPPGPTIIGLKERFGFTASGGEAWLRPRDAPSR